MKRLIFCILMIHSVVSLGEPIKSMIGSELAESQIEEEEEQNLLVWPTETINLRYGNPSTTRYWNTGIWYTGFAYSGYSNSIYYENVYFDDDSFHNYRAGSGYSMVQFFLLDAGIYDISYSYICETYSDNAVTYVSFYEPNGNGGWIYKSNSSTSLIWRYDEGSYKTECKRFTVPEGTMTGITISGINTDGRRGIDVWNVVLKKVD